MITSYTDAVAQAVLAVLTPLAVPLAIVLCCVLMAAAIVLAGQSEGTWLQRTDWRRLGGGLAGYAAVGLLWLVAWAALRNVGPLAGQDLWQRQVASATAQPMPDAGPICQYGPSVAELVERTYTRTLTLPPYLVENIGSEGVQVLAPYLTDPSAENVLKLVDTFRRSGQDVVFTRELTRLDEQPFPFTASQVKVQLKRLTGRAFWADFEGRYTFQNPRPAPITARFMFALPDGSTVRDFILTLGGQALAEPNDYGAYEWSSTLQPGERREAVVSYCALGAGTWRYDLGSQRRRVDQFQLEVEPGGPVRYPRGSLHPTSAGQVLRWDLDNVITAQQVAVALPSDATGRECYLQALGALPVGVVLFLLVVLLHGLRRGDPYRPAELATGLTLFTLGLGAAPILAGYAGPLVGVIVGPLAGALLAAAVLGRDWLPVGAPVALLPAAFLSPLHSGLLVLLLAVPVLAGLLPPRRPAVPAIRA